MSKSTTIADILVAKDQLQVVDPITGFKASLNSDSLTQDILITFSENTVDFKQYPLLSDITTALGTQDNIVACLETNTIYKYETLGALFTADNKYVLITGNGGATRWIGMAGKYCYAEKSGTFITDKLIAGTDSNALTISSATTLSNITGHLLLTVTGSDQEVTLPALGTDAVYSQYFMLSVWSTSPYSAIIQTTNTRLDTPTVLTPGTSALFICSKTRWHLIGGKKAITQLAQLGNPTYKTIQDWSNVTQSSGLLTGGILTDDLSGGVNVSALTAIAVVIDSTVGGTVFMDMPAGNVPASSLTDKQTNYICVDYNGGTPVYSVVTDRTAINGTTVFPIGGVFKDGAGLEVTNYEEITNISRRLIEMNVAIWGVQRVTGATVNEVGTRYLQTTDGLFYYGITKILTSGQNTSVAGEFDYYYRDGSNGWTITEGNTQVDNGYYDDGTGTLHAITPGSYGVMWVFICTEGDIYVMYGQNEYNLTDANNALLPSTLPPYMLFNTVCAAKIIFLQGATHFTDVISAYTKPFATPSPSIHNDLSGIQGGQAGQYYHLTAAEHSAVAGAGSISTGGFGRLPIYTANPTGKTLADGLIFGSYSVSVNIASHTLTSGRVYTLDDVGATASFVMTQGNQDLYGDKHFNDGIHASKYYDNPDSVGYITWYRSDKTTPIMTLDSVNNNLALHGVGSATVANLASLKYNAYDTVNGYIQNNIQNLSTGVSASSDWIATADSGNDSTNYIDLGINGSAFLSVAWTINGANDGYLYTSDGGLAIGTASAKPLVFFTGGTLATNQRGLIDATGHWANDNFTPTAWLHLKAGGLAINSAPLKFTSGSYLTTPEDGAMEYDGSHLSFTIGTVRTQLDGGTQRSTIQTTGAVATTITSVTLPADSVASLTVDIIGKQSGLSNVAKYRRTVLFKRIGSATVVQVSAIVDIQTYEENLNWDQLFTISGAIVDIQVQGVAATTIDWSCKLEAHIN